MKYLASALAFATVFLLPQSIEAGMSLIAGNVAVEVDGTSAWTISTATCNGTLRWDAVSSGAQQGTVVRVSDGVQAPYWIGGRGHGHETVLSASPIVDGVFHSLGDGAFYQGARILFDRTTDMGGVLSLRSTVVLSGDSIRERVHMAGQDAGVDVTVAYGFLYSVANRFTHYAGFDEQGGVLYAGETASDDDSFVHMYSSVAVAQYDPSSGQGSLSHVTMGTELGLTPFIWDRAEDNKVYFRFTDLERAADPATYDYDLELTTTFFDAGPTNWIATASEIVAVPEPSSISLLVAGIAIAAIFIRRRKRLL